MAPCKPHPVHQTVDVCDITAGPFHKLFILTYFFCDACTPSNLRGTKSGIRTEGATVIERGSASPNRHFGRGDSMHIYYSMVPPAHVYFSGSTVAVTLFLPSGGWCLYLV